MIATVFPSNRLFESEPRVGPLTKILKIRKRETLKNRIESSLNLKELIHTDPLCIPEHVVEKCEY